MASTVNAIAANGKPTIAVPIVMSQVDAAQYLGIGVKKLRKLIREGKIRAKLLDGFVKVSTQSCVEFLDALPDYRTGKGLRNH